MRRRQPNGGEWPDRLEGLDAFGMCLSEELSGDDAAEIVVEGLARIFQEEFPGRDQLLLRQLVAQFDLQTSPLRSSMGAADEPALSLALISLQL